ncbi:MAG TPA: prolyl oligopeptidase family serine peptidase [Phototrophicaceae bacterium]|nr:prolyl oligopeptidase family serine peptidase [Phototrophicaceae bacterium]
MSQQVQAFERKVTKTVGLKYLLHLPPDYEAQPKQRWPLILFLHGMGERGDDLEVVKKHGLARIAEEQPELLARFVVVSPQCPLDLTWPDELDALNALLDHCLQQYRIDRRRVYLTGLSMGGYGTWFLGMAHPERFAALAPICGGGVSARASTLKATPIWVFHGAKDRVVSPSESKRMVKALKACGNKVKLTLYPEADHDSWTETYNNPELYEWFLSHQLAK